MVERGNGRKKGNLRGGNYNNYPARFQREVGATFRKEERGSASDIVKNRNRKKGSKEGRVTCQPPRSSQVRDRSKTSGLESKKVKKQARNGDVGRCNRGKRKTL